MSSFSESSLASFGARDLQESAGAGAVSLEAEYDIADIGLADAGKRRILWADGHMPVLAKIRERFAREQPLAGLRCSACLHVTAETANLVRTLRAGGADVRLAASNPLSTQDDIAASLVRDFEVPTFGRRGEDSNTLYRHLVAILRHEPELIIDDAADMVASIIQISNGRFDDCNPIMAEFGRGLSGADRRALADRVLGSMEETTSGIVRLHAMEREGVLPFPVVAVNDARMKHFFDNRYGTGQSTLEAIIRATDLMLAGKTFVVAGYGWCGRGLAMRARGMGARVIVTEVNPVKALEAAMDGFDVMPMERAAAMGDIFCTVTGNRSIIDERHFQLMKDGAYVCNSGHFNVEVNVAQLEELATDVNRGRSEHIDEYVLENGHRIFLIAEGRLVNLVAASGHPAGVMDMSFAIQALATEWVVKNRGRLENVVHSVPDNIDEWTARLKLESMGIGIDRLTPEQERYLQSWNLGTA